MARHARWLGLVAAVIAAADDLWYLSLKPGGDGTARPVFVSLFVAAVAIAALATLWRGPRLVAAVLYGFGGLGMAALGLLGIFSIGAPLLLAAVLLLLAWAGWLLAPAAPVGALAQTAVGAALALALIGAGLYLTDVPVRCPSPDAQGGGATMFHGSYTFTCTGGRLSLKTG